MGKAHRRVGKEFEAEAVRLVETSGRTARDGRGSLDRPFDVAAMDRQAPGA